MFCSSYGPGAQEFGTEACFEHILVPQETRFPGRCCFSWTRIFAFNASVPKNMKNVFVRTRISRSKLLHRDESIRKKGFCAETGQPTNHETAPPGNRPTAKPGNRPTNLPLIFFKVKCNQVIHFLAVIMRPEYCQNFF